MNKKNAKIYKYVESCYLSKFGHTYDITNFITSTTNFMKKHDTQNTSIVCDFNCKMIILCDTEDVICKTLRDALFTGKLQNVSLISPAASTMFANLKLIKEHFVTYVLHHHTTPHTH